MKFNPNTENRKTNIVSSLQEIVDDLRELQKRNKYPHLGYQSRVTSVMYDYLKIADRILSVMSNADDSTFRSVSSFIAEKKESIDWSDDVSSYPEMLTIAKMHTVDDINDTISFIEKLISKQKNS